MQGADALLDGRQLFAVAAGGAPLDLFFVHGGFIAFLPAVVLQAGRRAGRCLEKRGGAPALLKKEVLVINSIA